MKPEQILVWDVPTRLFHWLLAASFAGAWVTAESERWLGLHVSLGYLFGALLLFRLLWGVAGSRYARFTSFVRNSSSVGRYLGSLLSLHPERHVGHNPAGGWAVLALLALGFITALSGIFALTAASDFLEELHEAAAGAMLALVMVHIAAVVLSSLLHRENLARAMLTGFKRGEPREGIRRPGWIAGTALLAGVIAVWSAANLGALPGTGPESLAAYASHDDDHDEDDD